MNAPTAVILIVVIALACLALRSIIRNKKSGGGCSCGCSGCGGGCSHCDTDQEKRSS